MWLKANYQKFKNHLRIGGLSFAIWRGIKYFIFLFLLEKQRDRFKQPWKIPENVISKYKIKITCSDSGINIFWNNFQVTKGAGLNVGINTLGLWTDSTKADWQVLERKEDYLKIKIISKDLPLSQNWTLRINNEQEIDWQIGLEVEEWLHIDEFRIACLVSPRYKAWINKYKQLDFPRLDNNWHDLYPENLPTFLVGVRFPVKGEFLPSFVLEGRQQNLFPLIQNPPLNNHAHIIGFRRIDSEEKKEYLAGNYLLFSGKINLFEDDSLLDTKIESLRQEHLRTMIETESKVKRLKRRLKILLANLPWQRDGKWGVRAGSRWPHIKDKSEGGYLPFPFFLAYATSLLQKHNIKAHIIDAIAEQIPEDIFIEKILGMDFDYLVTETSVPSFYDDLRMLKKIHKAGLPIILCGPNVEIYKPQFLKEHSCIDFVLYGEYEFSLLELIKSLQGEKGVSKVRGLIYRMDNEVIKNSKYPPFDINLLPWPHREELPMDKYWDLPGDIPLPSVQMLASRGCPFGCNFCLWPQVMYQGNHYRARDVKDVIEEMEYLVKEKKFKSVYFDDDTFNIDKQRMLRFCQEIKQRELHNILWAIMARPDLMDEEILRAMKSAGLWAVKYGIESLSPTLIKSCNKNMDIDMATKMIRMTKEMGIKVHLTFCFGLCGETKDSIQRTVDYALGLEPDSVQFSILTPFPGTRLFEELDRQDRILSKDWSKYDGHYYCVFKPDSLTPQDLVEAKSYAYRLWGEYVRRKRGFRGDIQRLKDYFNKYGFKYTLFKTLDYLEFVWIKRKCYLNG